MLQQFMNPFGQQGQNGSQGMQNQGMMGMQGMQGNGSDLLGYAGLLTAAGHRFQDALPLASQMAQQQASVAKQRYEAQQEAMQQQNFQKLGEFVGANPKIEDRQLASMALKLGVQPQNLLSFVSSLGPGYKLSRDPKYGDLQLVDRQGNVIVVEPGNNRKSPTFTEQQSQASQYPSTPMQPQQLQSSQPNQSLTQRNDNAGSGVSSPTYNDPLGTTINNGGSSTLPGEQRGGPGPTNPLAAPPPATVMPGAMPPEPEGTIKGQLGQPPQPQTNFKYNPNEDRSKNFNRFAQEDNPYIHKRKSLDDEKQDKKQYKENAAEVKETLVNNRRARNDMEIIKANLKNASTGKFGPEILEYKKMLERFGIETPEGASPAEVVQKTGNQLVISLLKSISNKPTNLDLQFAAVSQPGIATTEAGNRELIRIAEKFLDNDAQRAYAQEDWYKKRDGSLDGFDTTWDKFEDKNPLFDTYSSLSDKELNELIRKASKNKKR